MYCCPLFPLTAAFLPFDPVLGLGMSFPQVDTLPPAFPLDHHVLSKSASSSLFFFLRLLFVDSVWLGAGDAVLLRGSAGDLLDLFDLSVFLGLFALLCLLAFFESAGLCCPRCDPLIARSRRFRAGFPPFFPLPLLAVGESDPAVPDAMSWNDNLFPRAEAGADAMRCE